MTVEQPRDYTIMSRAVQAWYRFYEVGGTTRRPLSGARLL